MKWSAFEIDHQASYAFHFFTNRLEGDKQNLRAKPSIASSAMQAKPGLTLSCLGWQTCGTQGPTLTQETWTAALDVARILLENYWEKPQETVASAASC